MKKAICVILSVLALVTAIPSISLCEGAHYDEFKEKKPQQDPIFLRRNHKYAVCITSGGMLGAKQLEETNKYLEKLFKWSFGEIIEFLAAAFDALDATSLALWRNEAAHSNQLSETKLKTEAEMRAAEKLMNVPEVCAHNPMGYAFNKSDETRHILNAILAAESRNWAYGYSENMGAMDDYLSAIINEIEKTEALDMGTFRIDESQIGNFSRIGEVLFGSMKNPRPDDAGARYRIAETKAGIFRVLVSQAWRDWMLSRQPTIHFGLIRQWIEAWMTAAKRTTGKLDEEMEETEEDIEYDLKPLEGVLGITKNCTRFGVSRTAKYSGSRPGQPNPSKVNIVKANPYLYGLVVKAAKQYNIDPDVYAAVIGQESGGINQKENSSQCAGYAQLKRDVAIKDLNMKVTCVNDPKCDERMVPEKAIPAGAKHLSGYIEFCRKKLPRLDPTLCGILAYNQGNGRVYGFATEGKYKGRTMGCDGHFYTYHILGVIGEAVLEGVKFRNPEVSEAPDDKTVPEDPYKYEKPKDEGTPAVSPPGPGEEEIRPGAHEYSEGEIRRMLNMRMNYADGDMLSQEEVYQIIGDTFGSNQFHSYVDTFDENGVLKIWLPLRVMRYRLLSEIQRLARLNAVLKSLMAQVEMEYLSQTVETRIKR